MFLPKRGCREKGKKVSGFQVFKEIRWDIEMIGDVRDVIEDWLVEILKITNEQNFYPYLEENY